MYDLNQYRYAFNWTSFDPEKRFAKFVERQSNAESLIIEKCEKAGLDPAPFIEKSQKLACDYLSSESKCASAMVAGPANFNTHKQEKARNISMSKWDKWAEFHHSVMDKIVNRILNPKKTESEKAEMWKNKIQKIKEEHERIKLVNALRRQGKTAEIEEMIAKYPSIAEYVRDGYPSYRLAYYLREIERLEKQVKCIEVLQKRTSENLPTCQACKVEYDSNEIRWNLKFEGKPSEAVRNQLKSNGFKWSPTRSAWTRGAKTMGSKRLQIMLTQLESASND